MEQCENEEVSGREREKSLEQFVSHFLLILYMNFCREIKVSILFCYICSLETHNIVVVVVGVVDDDEEVFEGFLQTQMGEVSKYHGVLLLIMLRSFFLRILANPD